ncbi:hypothetical protein RV13_GL000003 [Enterococcus raffinosus]|nr:hypothetical protein RV13_GL000003 [Enterococcus raffinosus]
MAFSDLFIIFGMIIVFFSKGTEEFILLFIGFFQISLSY